MLILFDIDGTLITSRSNVSDGGSRDGVGAASMIEAGRNLYGPAFTLNGIEIAGRLDCLIWRDVAQRHGVRNIEAEHQRFRAEYSRVMRKRLDQGATVIVLPGVRELVQALSHSDGLTLGLLTGNYPETGRMKLSAAGLDLHHFTVGAWGCEGGSRRDLPPVAMREFTTQTGRQLSGRDVVIIGDTPHDIDCAKAHGCRSIGVATGSFSIDQLRACEADLAVENLSNTRFLVDWMSRDELPLTR